MDLMDIDTERHCTIDSLPDGVMRQIFKYLTPEELEISRQVCTRWNENAAHHHLWRQHCFKHSPSLRTERKAWPILACCEPVSPVPWRYVFRTLQNRPRWVAPLYKSGRFLCNTIVHLIKGSYVEIPGLLLVKRRFDIVHLPLFLGATCTYFYMEPLHERDKAPYEDFVQYLTNRKRAGLIFVPKKRLMLIPPCEYVRQSVNYSGERLIGALTAIGA